MIVAQSGFFYSRKSEKSNLSKGMGNLPHPLKVVNDGLIEGIERSAVTHVRYANLDQFITSNWRCS
ncbi:hypothetical protein Q7267_11715 [Glaesserella parasuis]|uniref:hypothetical protein n=1 Tax=Glaesserella parasuis TaxID=738 RepID=UPI0013656375|nr:hypothetical protein [Glaesserella parasuis]MDO9765202.1 hypothetical protein [Glaesserella parasuis]MDP0061460.1 hypothetical protein [Glaesserella parasuis]MDP0063731.1 hypothetical protein [Glaesserella parasuis]MDP0260822.1 hypothetical protein [Glaesserella parasuis]MDP0271675.1 hypothetical protein [Glaesserella parasuis]